MQTRSKQQIAGNLGLDALLSIAKDSELGASHVLSGTALFRLWMNSSLWVHRFVTIQFWLTCEHMARVSSGFEDPSTISFFGTVGLCSEQAPCSLQLKKFKCSSPRMHGVLGHVFLVVQ